MPSIPLPATTALLVIDVQCGWFLAHPPPHDSAGTLARINVLIDRAHTAGRSVFFVQHAEAPDCTAGTPAWELHPGLHRQPTDPLLAKTACDAFVDTALAATLREKGIDTLAITGAATEFCVDTTVRAAASLGFRVVVAADAHATKDRPILTAPQVIAHHNWVWSEMSAPHPIRVLPTAAIAFA